MNKGLTGIAKNVGIGLLILALFIGFLYFATDVFAAPSNDNKVLSTTNIYLSVDDYVDSSSPISNMGGGNYVGRNNYTTTHKTYRTFTRYDLSSVNPNNDYIAEFYVLCDKGLESSDILTDIHFVSDDAWTDTITWNTQPSYTTLLDSFTVTSAGPAWKIADISIQFNTELQGDEAISMLIKGNDETQDFNDPKHFTTWDDSWGGTNQYIKLTWESDIEYEDNATSQTYPLMYYPDANHSFGINCTDNDGIYNAIFESNYTGTLDNYTNSTPGIDGIFNYSFIDYGVMNFTGRWICNDTASNENATDTLTYTFYQNTTPNRCNYTNSNYTNSNWNITANTNCSISDTSYQLIGNLTIYGNLTLENVDIIMNISGWENNITTYDGSNLIILSQTNLTSNDSSYGYKFISEDGAKLQINDSYIGYVYYGLQIKSDNTIINNNTISNNFDNGIYFYQTSQNNYVENNIINNMDIKDLGSSLGIRTSTIGANGTIQSNEIYNVDVGLYMSATGWTMTLNNIYNTETGIYLDEEGNTISDTNITNSSLYDIHLGGTSKLYKLEKMYLDGNYDQNVNITFESRFTGTLANIIFNRTSDTTTSNNITGFLNITNFSYIGATTDSWVYLNMSYNPTTVTSLGLTEGILNMSKYDGTIWSYLVSSVNQVDNYVYFNITDFSIFTIRGDATFPQFYNASTNPNTPATYSTTGSNEFNITTTDNVDISDVWFEWIGVNYSYNNGDISRKLVGSNYNYYKTISKAQTVAVYTYTWYANDTVNNVNSTSGTYEIITSGTSDGGGSVSDTGDDSTTDPADTETNPPITIDPENPPDPVTNPIVCPEDWSWVASTTTGEGSCIQNEPEQGTVCCEITANTYDWIIELDCASLVDNLYCELQIPECGEEYYWSGDACMAIPIITIITDDGTGGGGGGSSTQTCGNGWCEYPENIGSCPQDCLSSGDDGNVTFGVKPPYIRVFGELGQETHCPSENYCSVTIENPNSESIYVYVELNKVTDFETELIDPSYQWASINTIDNPEQVNSLTVMIPGGNAFVPGKKIITVRNEIPINVAETEYEFNLYFVSSGEKHIVRYKTQVGEFNLLAYTDEVFSRILYTQICLPNGKCFNSWVIVSIALAILLLAFYIYIWKKTLEKKKRYKKRR